MSDRNQVIAILETHMNSLSCAKTFEEYRDAHVRFVKLLIDREKARQAQDSATNNFVNMTIAYIDRTTMESSDAQRD